MATMQSSQSPSGISNNDMQKYIGKIGEVLRRNQVNNRGGNEDKFIKQIDEAYKQFAASVKDQEAWMKKATDEQKEVYRGITENFYKLRKSDAKDFDALHEEFKAAIVQLNAIDGDHPAKGELEKLASIGMKHTDKTKAKPTGLVGALKGEFGQRVNKYFKPTDAHLESPLFRHLAGLDKKGPGGLNPLTALQNEGTAEKLIRQAGEKITGEEEKDKANKASAMAGEIAGGSGKGGAFPSKIENLHVENLIVKMVKRAEGDDVKAPRYMQEQLPGSSGKSAIAINHPQLPGPSGGQAHAEILPPLPHDPSPALLEHNASPLQLGHVAPKLLNGPKHDAEDVAFTETAEPIQFKQRNPHAKLKTGLTPLASAMSGAIDAYPTMKGSEGVVGAVKATDALESNDIGPRNADATLETDKGDSGAAAGAGGGLLSAALAAAELLKGKKDKAKADEEEKAKAKEDEKGKVEEKTKTSEAADDIKSGEKGLGAEAEGLAGDAKGASKFLKGAKVGGKLLGAAGAAITVGTSAMDYMHADDELKAGHITAQQAKEAKSKAVAGGGGALAGGWAGAESGALAGAAIGSFVPGIGTAIGGVAGGLIGGAVGAWGGEKVGDKLGEWWAKPSDSKDVSKVAQDAAHNSKPTVVVAHQGAQSAPQSSAPSIVPVKAEPRARESYFDRQMMNTVMF